MGAAPTGERSVEYIYTTFSNRRLLALFSFGAQLLYSYSGHIYRDTLEEYVSTTLYGGALWQANCIRV